MEHKTRAIRTYLCHSNSDGIKFDNLSTVTNYSLKVPLELVRFRPVVKPTLRRHEVRIIRAHAR